MSFVLSFQSEWQKKRRSLSSWLVIVGAFFTPLILFIYKLTKYHRLPNQNAAPKFWEGHWFNSWESMALFLLPIGVILTISLITQLEYKNNTWKQLHTTPQRLSTIFFAKLSVSIIMLLQCLVLFGIGVYLSAVLPGLITGAPYPAEPLPIKFFAVQTFEFFITCLPIIALQYLISLQFKNFIIPIGVGVALWVLSIAVLRWKYGYTVPYTYCGYHFLHSVGKLNTGINYQALSIGYFVLFTVVSYILFVRKKERG